MSYRARYDKGDWKAICDVCGRIFKGSQLRQRWDGYKVCNEDWEPRQPQDFVRGVVDTQVPPWTRPEAQDQFIYTCTPTGMSSTSDYAISDCAVCDVPTPSWYVEEPPSTFTEP